MESERYSRQELIFGKEGQKKLKSVKVGIVGLGGTGSHVVQGLTYMGIENFVLIDDDYVEETNLNRLIGAYSEDINNKTLKVDVMERMILNINSNVFIEMISKNLRSKEAIDALIQCDVIFGCVDHEAPRFILMNLSAAYKIDYIDLATEIFEGEPLNFGGRIVVCKPGEFCLKCADEINIKDAKEELLSKDAQIISRKHGYGIQESTAPSVVSLNGIVANIALTEFLLLITGKGRSPTKISRYVGNEARVKFNNSEREEGCFICEYIYDNPSEANIYQYVVPDEI